MCTRSGVYNLSKKVAVFFRNMDFESQVGELYGEFDLSTNIIRDFTKDSQYYIKYPFKTKFSKHSFVDAGIFKEVEVVTDGINNAGLSISSLWNHESEVDTSYTQPSDCISGLTLPQLLLANCANINDIISLLGCKKVEYWDRDTKQKTFKYVGTKRIHIPTNYLANKTTCHLHLSDTTGTSYVIEFEKDDITDKAGIPVLYRDPYHNITNAPHIRWQHTNLRTQVGAMDMYIQNKGKVLDSDITPTGYGNNWRGMPADYTPPSRFLRALLIKSAMLKQKTINTIDDAMVLLDKIKGSTRVPYGLTADTVLGSTKIDSTIWTIMVDLFNYKIYQEDASKIGFGELICIVQKSIKF